MNSGVLAFLSLVLLVLAYRLYGRVIAKRLFEVSADRPVPSIEKEDGIDYVPTNRYVLFGHHFASIAGASPIVGPAIAVIYGWVPALLWILGGSILMGGIHDMSAMILSVRRGGKSICDITEELVNPRVRVLFTVFVFFLLMLVVAVFARIIGGLFMSYPQSVFPAAALIVIALVIGVLVYKFGLPLMPATIAGVVLMGLSIWFGLNHPIGNEHVNINLWIVILLAYAYMASVMPVWLLLQPRDYLNSFGLYFGMGVTYLALFVAPPAISAPAFRPTGAGAPPMIPFLFILIACGAISGFHSLVASGTTSRQLRSELDVAFVGYGGMLVEGALSVMVVFVCCAGLGAEAWNARYAQWATVSSGLSAKLSSFMDGGDALLQHIGFPPGVGGTLLTVTVVGFALTSLDTACRIMRFTVSEIGKEIKVPALQNRYLASFIAVACGLLLATIKIGDKPTGLVLWPTFGATNQGLACLGLLTVSVYLIKLKKPVLYTLLPAAFMLVVTSVALTMKIYDWIGLGAWVLVAVGTIIIVIQLWISAESIYTLIKARNIPEPIIKM
ncbi:MAG: carbon starvation protein A [Candidatus Hydrogenedentes bacterium]|nr:carbon starvation protein A [Candidatus Hydrogenedentota bacterium]